MKIKVHCTPLKFKSRAIIWNATEENNLKDNKVFTKQNLLQEPKKN